MLKNEDSSVGYSMSQLVAREFSPQLINNPEALSANARLAEPLNYARFFVDQLLPADAETAIYLDSDVTVRASLGPPGAARGSSGESPAAEATCTKGGARAEVGSRRRGVMY